MVSINEIKFNPLGLPDNNVNIPFPPPQDPTFTFIDLFAGIGGFRMALQNIGGACVFSSEYDKYSQKTYHANFGEWPHGDITNAETKLAIPEHFDILCGGFPCQPFSLAGVVKKSSMGRKHGFEDEKQGLLFYHIVEILDNHRPKAFFLENVKNLLYHDKGNTLKEVKEQLEAIHYSFDIRVINGSHFVPQHRERAFMVGFDKKVFGYNIRFDFDTVRLPPKNHQIKNILLDEVDKKFTLSDRLWNYLQAYAYKHQKKGNGFGYSLVDLNGISRTLLARYYKDGAEILIPQENANPRRLTPRECAALQGYPVDKLEIPVSDMQAYIQLGNSVVMPLVEAIGKEIIKLLKNKNPAS